MNDKAQITKAFLHGLAEPLRSELVAALRSTACDEAESLQTAQIVFCDWDPGNSGTLKTQFGALPVVVVSRAPDVTGWLDALEAGAADYCAAPFESIHLRWILDAHLRQPMLSTAHGNRQAA